MIVEVKSSGLVVREGSEVIVLTCEVYGYPRDSSPPKWSSPGRNLETGRFITTLSDTGPLSGGSVSSTDKVTVSQLTIYCASETDNGEYTCSVDGQSDTFRVDLGKLNSETLPCKGGMCWQGIRLYFALYLLQSATYCKHCV